MLPHRKTDANPKNGKSSLVVFLTRRSLLIKKRNKEKLQLAKMYVMLSPSICHESTEILHLDLF